jgi:hypothetical protein
VSCLNIVVSRDQLLNSEVLRYSNCQHANATGLIRAANHDAISLGTYLLGLALGLSARLGAGLVRKIREHFNENSPSLSLISSPPSGIL